MYKTDEDVRAEKRAELGLSPNDFVIGNIGRLEKQKIKPISLISLANYYKRNQMQNC
ncbi:hypothetical protein SNF32_06665 [Enterococcus mundtii]|nr:hypothetical protein [Enterococcus mundtii]